VWGVDVQIQSSSNLACNRYIYSTWRWPVGAETCRACNSNNKIIRKIQLRLTEPKNIVVIDATECSPANINQKQSSFLDLGTSSRLVVCFTLRPLSCHMFILLFYFVTRHSSYEHNMALIVCSFSRCPVSDVFIFTCIRLLVFLHWQATLYWNTAVIYIKVCSLLRLNINYVKSLKLKLCAVVSREAMWWHGLERSGSGEGSCEHGNEPSLFNSVELSTTREPARC
jgi:hypothetical protein